MGEKAVGDGTSASKDMFMHKNSMMLHHLKLGNENIKDLEARKHYEDSVQETVYDDVSVMNLFEAQKQKMRKHKSAMVSNTRSPAMNELENQGEATGNHQKSTILVPKHMQQAFFANRTEPPRKL